LGLALAQQGKLDEANTAFLTTLRPAEAKANIAFVLAAQGKRDEAKDVYEEALKLEPSLTTARQGLGALEKGPPSKEPVQQTSAKSKPTEKKPNIVLDKKPEKEPDQSPFVIDPATIGKSR
jgi:hypothetical protein